MLTEALSSVRCSAWLGGISVWWWCALIVLLWCCVERYHLVISIVRFERALKLVLLRFGWGMKRMCIRFGWRMEWLWLRGLLFTLYRLKSLENVSDRFFGGFVSHCVVVISWMALLSPNAKLSD